MAMKSKAVARLKEAKAKLQDRKFRAKVLEAVKVRLKRGRAQLAQLERRIDTPANREKAAAALKRAKARIAKVRREFKKRERKALAYTVKHPKKALRTAALAGALVGGLAALLRRRR